LEIAKCSLTPEEARRIDEVVASLSNSTQRLILGTEIGNPRSGWSAREAQQEVTTTPAESPESSLRQVPKAGDETWEIPKPTKATETAENEPAELLRAAAGPDTRNVSSSEARTDNEPKMELASVADDLPFVVRFAGLVLLHPFLVRLFQATGVVQVDMSRLSRESTERAAAMLCRLVQPDEPRYEFELGFIKVLLGMHPAAYLSVDFRCLSTSQRTECDLLLEAAIEHWGALKKTSPQGLREAFLQRGGLLRHDQDAWKLQVERRSMDVLLDRLPWAISVIKLPWMRKAIYTEW
jgi:hypothetical protein